MTTKAAVGLIGLSVMGQNLALNIAEKAEPICVWNRTPDKVDQTVCRAAKEGGLPLFGFKDLRDFVGAISCPRRIFILVKAGAPVDAILSQLLPLVSPNDVLIDGGNEWYKETERRQHQCDTMNIRYMAVGVSGGEEGARNGPSLMPGGQSGGYKEIQGLCEKIAAQVDDGPCVSYIGPGGSGNYVKMVHNGIEYGDMQLIAEAYDVLKRVGGLSNEELRQTFTEWNKGELQSFLIEITADIFAKKDDDNNANYLLDTILDSAGSKGTGKWTVQEAAELGVPCPTIAAALEMRYLSIFKSQRMRAAEMFPKTEPSGEVDVATLKAAVRDALYCSKICSYAQGLMLLRTMSDAKDWKLRLGEVARTWKGGCIIRAAFLDDIKKAYERNPNLSWLLEDGFFSDQVRKRCDAWRRIVIMAHSHGIAIPALSSSLSYFDAFRSRELPMNLVQAQRDFFGAHTFQRVDKEGTFHAKWH